MIGKKSSLNIYKIGSLAVLLGFFGLFETSTVFAQNAQGNGAVSTVCKEQVPTDSNTHQYTCQEPTNTDGLCGTTDGTDDKLFNEFSCPSISKNGKTIKLVCHRCVCQGTQTWQNGKCAAPVTAPATPAPAKDCVGNTAKNALGACTNCKPGYQRNSSKEGEDKCEDCNAPGVCCGVKLNTTVPFVGKCIRTDNTNADGKQTTTTPTDAFPKLMGALVKIMTTVILLICFGGILVGGVMIASSGGETKRASDGKALIGKVVIAIAVLGSSGIILHLINPNFFG